LKKKCDGVNKIIVLGAEEVVAYSNLFIYYEQDMV
jgi:hypothetical protein